MADQTLNERPERWTSEFDGTEIMESFPTTDGISYRTPLGTVVDKNTGTADGEVPTNSQRDGRDNTFAGANIFSQPISVAAATQDSHAVRFDQAASIKTIIEYGTPLGQYIYMPGAVKQPAAYDSADPDTYWPAVCLDDINISKEITETNFPKLPSFLRDIAVTYQDYDGGAQKYQFDVTDYVVSSGTATLTFADTDAENSMLESITEDNLVHGSFTDWITITLPGDIGNISAGDYAITDVDEASRTISFSTSASDSSGSVTAVTEIRPHRIPGSSTSARLFQVTSRTVASAGDGADIAGLRRRDQMQRITGSIDTKAGGGHATSTGASGAFTPKSYYTSSSGGISGDSGYRSANFDSTDSPSARTSSSTDGPTRGRELVGHLYMWAREYKTT